MKETNYLVIPVTLFLLILQKNHNTKIHIEKNIFKKYILGSEKKNFGMEMIYEGTNKPKIILCDMYVLTGCSYMVKKKQILILF
jgi:hypothetical protein